MLSNVSVRPQVQMQIPPIRQPVIKSQSPNVQTAQATTLALASISVNNGGHKMLRRINNH